ncbi:MAG TPA: hypothetical protein VHG71_08730 [Verrucomicrobiae bacterium]|nr:hypothetical protein [Verrucomicrobiae bacterium]
MPLIFLLAGGCATQHLPTSHLPPLKDSFPANGFITQRALFTAHGRQFALNGYLAVSATGGWRFIVTETLGSVVADVLVKPDGKIFVMQSSRLFPEKYIRRLMVRDLQCIFGKTNDANYPVKKPDANHFLIERRGYSLDVRILETKPDAQPAELFDETYIKPK